MSCFLPSISYLRWWENPEAQNKGPAKIGDGGKWKRERAVENGGGGRERERWKMRAVENESGGKTTLLHRHVKSSQM
jgi:hypothetical protein